VYLTPVQRPALADLCVSSHDLGVRRRSILKQIVSIMARISGRAYVLFTLAAGIVVLLAAVQSTGTSAAMESAMLRTLAPAAARCAGRSPRIFRAGLSSAPWRPSAPRESVGKARRSVFAAYTLDPWVWVVGLICGTILVGLSGTLATRRVVNTPPIHTLRDD